MRYKTLFRVLLKAIGVLLKAIGVLLVGQAIPRVTDHGMLFLYVLTEDVGDWMEALYYPAVYGNGGAGNMVQLVLGLYLFFGGKWVTNLAIPDNRSYCPACGYQLTGPDGATCPHCGGATGDAVSSGTL